MPYAPGIQYHGDKYLFDAISGIGRDVGDAVRKYRSEREESQFLDGAFQTMMAGAEPALRAGVVKPEDIKKFDGFAGASLSKKRGMIAQLGFAMNQWGAQTDRGQRKAEADAAAGRADKSIEIQQGQLDLARQGAARQQDSQDRLDTFGALVQRFMSTPRFVSAPMPFGPTPVPTQPRLTEQDVARFAAQAGILSPRDADGLLANQRDQFRPEFGESPDGTPYMTTSRGSAIPIRQGADPEDRKLNELTRMYVSLTNGRTRALTPQDKADIDQRRTEIAARIRAIDPTWPIEDTQGGGDEELRNAREALAKGVPRDRVAALYKKRTGKDLP